MPRTEVRLRMRRVTVKEVERVADLFRYGKLTHEIELGECCKIPWILASIHNDFGTLVSKNPY